MTNFEKIREAWRIGWAAVLKFRQGSQEALAMQDAGRENTLIVILILDNLIVVRDSGGVQNLYSATPYYNIEECEIIGFLFAGELAGNEEPREGQRFRKRDSSLQWVYDFGDLRSSQNHSLRLSFKKIDKTKWHPYFD